MTKIGILFFEHYFDIFYDEREEFKAHYYFLYHKIKSVFLEKKSQTIEVVINFWKEDESDHTLCYDDDEAEKALNVFKDIHAHIERYYNQNKGEHNVR